MTNDDLIKAVRSALVEWIKIGMSDDEFASIINLKDQTLDGGTHRKWRLDGHLQYAMNHQGNYQIGSLKHQQHLKIAAHYLLNK
ncbi:hypothetical protein O1B79_003502 [Vibrio cholerae]|nr:hypothetical protein [Vibrio cholerae]